ncbi:MAG: sigma 54-interacting transcriptional regulator [Myxococcota bacterium]
MPFLIRPVRGLEMVGGERQLVHSGAVIPDSRTLTAVGWDSDETSALHRRLVQVFGPQAPNPQVVDLSGERVVIGREPGEGHALRDGTASRRHAEIRRGKDDRYEVVDLSSKNGSWVDGQRVRTGVLRSGSVLRTGEHLFVFEELRGSAGQALEPGPECSLARAWSEHLVGKAAESEHPLLIRGPTGAGKERLASLYHEASGRSGALVPVNCAAFSSELLGSELFGHVQGAFSGAKDDRDGLILSAHGGTLFLDEVADLPMDQQPALLRVLQERRVRPVGSDKERSVDVRLISATHKDLEELSETGDFRTDLFARLAGLVVHLPGLARRRVEILPLLRGFAPGLRLGVAAVEALLLYHWPRNIRELQALAGQLAVLGDNSLELAALPTSIRIRPRTQAPAEVTEESLRSLLDCHRGKVAEVARSLGKSRQATYRLLQDFGIDPGPYRSSRD